MTNSFSCLASTPEPWPIAPNADGALAGDLPLTMPRRRLGSPTVVITSRDVAKKVTSYTIRRPGAREVAQCKIDTCNEWILKTGVGVDTVGGKPRVRVGSQLLSVIVASQNPSRHVDRIYVDHADNDTCNDTIANLHWVTVAFNLFNTERKRNASGYIGVCKHHNRFTTGSQGLAHGSYDNAKTAARVYDLTCTIAYGDQLLKTPHQLNNLDQDKHVFLIYTHSDSVNIYKVDDIFVVIYKGKVENIKETVEAARGVAKTLVARHKTEEERKEEEWKETVKGLTIRRNKQDIAHIPLKAKATDSQPAQDVEILLDDKDWLEVQARKMKLYLTWADRAVCRSDGVLALLSRWLLSPAPTDIVDHVSRNVLDHRRSNLTIRDRAANMQNVKRGDGIIGVHWSKKASRWVLVTRVKGQKHRSARLFDDLDAAIELHDLVALYQHGPNALINRAEKLSKYLDKLRKEDTLAKIKEFLEETNKKKSSMFLGVSWAKPRFFRANVYVNGKRAQEPTSHDQFKKGSEVRAAISYDLWKLKLKAPDFVINFNHLRPCYQHWLPELTKANQDAFIEKAYELLGGDSFDLDIGESLSPTPPPASYGGRLSTSASGSSEDPVNVSDLSSSLPTFVPLPCSPLLGKRKARE